jgi:predicted transcriptional regulator
MNSIHDIRDMARLHKIQMKQVCAMAQIQQPQVSRWLSGAVDPLWCSVNQMEQALLTLIEQQEQQAPAEEDAEAAQP